MFLLSKALVLKNSGRIRNFTEAEMFESITGLSHDPLRDLPEPFREGDSRVKVAGELLEINTETVETDHS